jgi:hypothetical protein
MEATKLPSHDLKPRTPSRAYAAATILHLKTPRFSWTGSNADDHLAKQANQAMSCGASVHIMSPRLAQPVVINNLPGCRRGGAAPLGGPALVGAGALDLLADSLDRGPGLNPAADVLEAHELLDDLRQCVELFR